MQAFQIASTKQFRCIHFHASIFCVKTRPFSHVGIESTPTIAQYSFMFAFLLAGFIFLMVHEKKIE